MLWQNPKLQIVSRFWENPVNHLLQTLINFFYHTKESRPLLQILEPGHLSASGEISIKQAFQKEKYFISNEILKTRIFYEFILVDTESIQISHVKNPKGNDIAYSK